jgi:hypothetical protein
MRSLRLKSIFTMAGVLLRAALLGFVEMVRSLPVPFTFVARAENLIRGRPDLDDTIKRLQAFEKACADVLGPGVGRMRRFFGPQGSVSRVTIESEALKNNLLGDPSVRAVMCTFRPGMTDEDCPCLWILSASRAAAYPIRVGPVFARTCRLHGQRPIPYELGVFARTCWNGSIG